MYSDGSDGADAARAQESARQARIDKGMGAINQKFASFDPKFYDDRAKAYENYALPQEQQQEDRTRRTLAYSLANAGLTDSGSGVTRNAVLDREAAVQKRAIADAGVGSANELRGQVESQRTGLVNQLESTADPNVAATGAYAAASNLRAPTAMQPVGDLFGDFTRAYVTNQTAKSYNDSNGGGQASPWSMAVNGGNGTGSTGSSRIIP
jgi:hypothetical protein